MTREEAISTAQEKARRYERAYMVTSRTDHPAAYPDGETVYLAFPKSDKQAWAPDERLVFDTDYPDDLTAAWYAADCPPMRPQRMTIEEMRERAKRALQEAGL